MVPVTIPTFGRTDLPNVCARPFACRAWFLIPDSNAVRITLQYSNNGTHGFAKVSDQGENLVVKEEEQRGISIMSRGSWTRGGGMLWLAVVLGLVFSAGPAQGGIPTLRDSLKDLAQGILEVVKKDQGQPSIAVDEAFSSPLRFDANAGPGISEAIKSLLEELAPGVVQRRASLLLRGRYDKARDPRDAGLIVVNVTAEILNADGRLVAERTAVVRDTGLVAELLGTTVALPPAATRTKRNEILREMIDKPRFTSAGTEVRSAPESPYAVEILVTSKDQVPKSAKEWESVPARAVHDKDGQPFVDIKGDEAFAIRIHNNVESDAAVAISIDGIDIFNFSKIRDAKTDQPKYTQYICPPGQTTIPGWHKTNEHFEFFFVTQYANGAISKMANASRREVGLITLRFALAWKGELVPEAERGARDAGSETGFGPPTKTELEAVARQVGVVRDVINIHYTQSDP
jgi:hypothetical protein